MARDKAIIEAEIAGLETRLKARRGKSGFGDNVRALEARLAECREELASAGD